MKLLHQVTVPDTPQSTDVSRLTCLHCHKQIEHGDSFTVRADGYFERSGYTPCTPNIVDATE